MSVVNVLTPNGRRQNVKVQPNTTILQVLEEVCQKHQFDANEYDLKHHKRILDLSLMYRFTGLPNNAQLEMVEAQKKRQEQEVVLVIQSVDGARSEGTYKPSVSLGDVLQELCPAERLLTDLIVIYMRTEVPHDKLAETTLKQLGLVGGRAILRLIRRDPAAARTQANVSSVLVARPQPKTEEETKEEPKKFKPEESSSTGQILSSLRGDVLQKDGGDQNDDETPKEVADVTTAPGQDPIDSMEVDDVLNIEPVAAADVARNAAGTALAKEKEEEEEAGNIHIIGERNAVLFSLETATRLVCDDLPDSFFDLDVKDLKTLLRDLRTESKGSVDQPLLTAQMRELEESKRQLNRLNTYKKSIIRVQFPNRYVLQATFTPMETIETVHDFVRTFLVVPQIDFHLFTTPPKMILPKESRLFEVNCVPSAVLHFGSNDKCDNILRPDVLSKVSSPNASLMLALKEREMYHNNNEASGSGNEASGSGITASGSGAVAGAASKPSPNSFRASTASDNNDAKLPKWFKK